MYDVTRSSTSVTTSASVFWTIPTPINQPYTCGKQNDRGLLAPRAARRAEDRRLRAAQHRLHERLVHEARPEGNLLHLLEPLARAVELPPDGDLAGPGIGGVPEPTFHGAPRAHSCITRDGYLGGGRT